MTPFTRECASTIYWYPTAYVTGSTMDPDLYWLYYRDPAPAPAEGPPRRRWRLFWPPDQPGEPATPHAPELPAQPVRVHKSPRTGLGLKNYRKAA